MSDVIAPETGTETITPNEPAAETPVTLPADHPLVKTLAAQKAQLAELRTRTARLDEIEDAQKTEAQKLADAAARSQQEAAEARAEAARYKVAASHGIGADYFDLLGSGDEETITGRAERLSPLLKVVAENEQLKAEIEALRQGKPSPSGRPVAQLKPGASPEGNQSEADVLYQSLFGS